MIDVPFMGMRASDDFVTNARPENWREGLLLLYPNGRCPLTALTALMTSQSTDDPHYHWWTEALPNQRAAITGVYTDVLSTLYTTGATAGTTLYFKMAAADVDKIRLGHQVMARCSVDPTLDVVGRVTVRAKNGANSYVGVYLHEADDNSAYGFTLSRTDVLWIIGNMNAEGATMPTAITYDPVEHYNYTQIFRTPLSKTRTAKKTRLRTGDHVKQAQRQALELHGIEMEKAFIFGKRTLATDGTTGTPIRTTGGIREFITTNRFNYPYDGGGAWLTDGWDYLMEKLKEVFRYGERRDRIGYCGPGVLLALAKLAKEYGTFELTKMETKFGIEILEWLTPFGRLYLKDHPLFALEDTLQYAMLVVNPDNLTYRYIDDTKYLPNRQANDLDGEASEYLTECGLEVHHEMVFAWFDGLGVDSYGTLTTGPATTVAPTTLAPTTAAPTTL